MNKRLAHILLVSGILLLVIGSVNGALFGMNTVSLFLIAGFVLMAISFQGFKALRGFSYTMWILTAVTASLYFPHLFMGFGGFSFRLLIIPLLQMIMFGVGSTMGLNDFLGVIKMPRGVIVGILCHFTIMPLVGYSLSKIFGFPSEIAAGIILVGSVPCGLASNVMSYLANANVALSVTLTAVATLMAPLITPLLMQSLAGEYVTVNFLSMMWDIIKIVIIPVAAGLLFNHFLSSRIVWLNKVMPLVSMISIAAIITIITAAGHDSLLTVGWLLVLACFLHNSFGFLLGYGACKLLRMDERSCRTIAIEVGLQNAGLASGLALGMGKIATVGLAPAIFGPLMNVTGSSLATWWQNKPVKD
jgi:bile acid:Na+ symporter, BASS family